MDAQPILMSSAPTNPVLKGSFSIGNSSIITPPADDSVIPRPDENIVNDESHATEVEHDEAEDGSLDSSKDEPQPPADYTPHPSLDRYFEAIKDGVMFDSESSATYVALSDARPDENIVNDESHATEVALDNEVFKAHPSLIDEFYGNHDFNAISSEDARFVEIDTQNPSVQIRNPPAHYIRFKLTKSDRFFEAVSYLIPTLTSSLSIATTKIPVIDKTREDQLSIDNALISSLTTMPLCLIGFFIGMRIRDRIAEIHDDQTPKYQYCENLKPYIAISSVLGLSAGLLTGFSQQKSNSRESILPGAILSTGVSFILGSIDYVYHLIVNESMKDQSEPDRSLSRIRVVESLTPQSINHEQNQGQ